MTFVQLHRQAIKDPIGGLYHVDIGVFEVYDVDVGVFEVYDVDIGVFEAYDVDIGVFVVFVDVSIGI